MELNDKIKRKFSRGVKKSQYLHSPDHVLADELSLKFSEPRRFGFYLKMAETYNHSLLRKIAGEVLEAKAKKPGALFTYLLKKYSDQPK